jgi:hypothetical protein
MGRLLSFGQLSPTLRRGPNFREGWPTVPLRPERAPELPRVAHNGPNKSRFGKTKAARRETFACLS